MAMLARADVLPDTRAQLPTNPLFAVPLMRVLVINRDRVYSELLRKTLQMLATTSKIIIACSIAEASAALAQSPVDVLVTSVLAADGEVLDALPDWVENRRSVQQPLVVTSRKEPCVLERLSGAPIRGVFDSDGDIAGFQQAFAAVAAGREYWSPTVHRAFERTRAPNAPLRNLSRTERLVLAVVGAGYDDALSSETTSHDRNYR